MANIPLQYPFPYKTINSTGFTSSVEFVNVTVLGDVTIDQNLTVSGNITTTDLTVGDDLTVGGQIDAQVLRAYGIWDTPIQTVNGAGAWVGFDSSGHTIFGTRKATAGQTNSFRWYAYTETNAFQAELMRLSSAGNLFISGTRIEFPLIHLYQPTGTFPSYDFILPTSMGSSGQVLTSAGVGNPTYWTTPSGGGGGGGGGTVTNVSAGTMPSAMTMTITSPTTTPIINISATTVGSNAFVRKDVANMTELTVNGAPAANLYITSGTAGVGSLANTSTLYLTQVGGGGGFVNQWIQAAYNATYGYHISINCSNDLAVNATRSFLTGTAVIGTASAPPVSSKLYVDGDYGTFSVNGINANYWGFYMSGTRKSYIGIPDTNNELWLYNEHATGHIILQTSNASGRIRCAKPILLEETVTLSKMASGVGLKVNGRIQSENSPGDVGALSLKTGSDENYLFTNGASGLYADINNGAFVVRSTPASAFNRVAAFLAPSNTYRSYVDLGKAATANNGCLLGYDTGTTGQFVIAHHGITGELVYSANQTLTCPGTVLARRSTDCQVSINPESSGSAGVEVRAIGSVAYLDLTAATPSPGADYDFRIRRTNGSTHTNFEMTVAGGGGYVFDRTVRATNYTTNGVDTFTYASGSFTPRIAMFYTSDGKVYECNNAPPGKDNMGITYSVQTGRWVRVGNLITVNMEIQYSQTYSGITFDLTNLNIVAVIPDAVCNPSTLGAVGMVGYPSRIADRFVDNFQMNYWISNTAYAPGGTICEVQLRRNNTHDMLPWDPTSKGGQRVNITTSYYVSQ